MNKLFFCLLAATSLLLSSCGNDNEVINSDNGSTNSDNEATYPVTIKLKGFLAEVTPLKRTGNSIPENHYCRYVFYNEDGTVYRDEMLVANDPEKGSNTLTVNLPEKKFNLAIIAADKEILAYPIYKFTPNNYYTDTLRTTKETYYQNQEFTVKSDGTTTLDLTLEPMWSTLDIIVDDHATCYVAPNIEELRLLQINGSSAFKIKNKEAVYGHLGSEQLGSILLPAVLTPALFKENGIADLSIIGPSNNSQITVQMLTSSVNGVPGIASEKILYDGELKRGCKYTLRGSFGSPTSTGNIELSVNKLVDVPVIPFKD